MPAMSDSLLAKLQGFRPDAVCIESLPGVRVRELELRQEAGPVYKDVLDGFASRRLSLAKPASPLVNASPETAALKVGGLLSSFARTKPGERTSEAHATLALWMAAAHRPVSAALHLSWLSDE